MSTRPTSGLVLTRTDFDRQPQWALTGNGALRREQTDFIRTADLEALPLDREELRNLVKIIMASLEIHSAGLVSTPGGADWLHMQHVPVRRFVGEIVRKLLALSAWEPFATAPGPLSLASYEGLVGLRSSSSREYLPYTITWSGIAYLLGAEAPFNPLRSAQLRNLARASTATTEHVPLPSDLAQCNVVALSWSSRHAATLTPVLTALRSEGQTGLLLDLATDPAERCPAPASKSIDVCSPPSHFFTLSGTAENLQSFESGQLVRVKGRGVQLDRIVRLLSVVLEESGGCTQPSWRSIVRTESWLDDVLATARPHTVLLSNDTSPLGVLAVHAAERHRANSVHVQHGAWTAESVAWPALHSRDVVVMGQRDHALAAEWARHPNAEVHVLGQPRFDALADLGREAQRRYLQKLLAYERHRAPARIAVWACQPFGPGRLKVQADLLLSGLREAGDDWGLVIAPHPAQDIKVFSPLLRCEGGPPIAVADPRVGARGCLAGADAVASAYSTCGIEAALLGIPVLEIGAPGERTLDLASHGLAQRCSDAHDVAAALVALRDSPIPIPIPAAAAATDAVCRRPGDSAARVARLITDRAEACTAPADSDHDDSRGAASVPPQGEGVPTR